MTLEMRIISYYKLLGYKSSSISKRLTEGNAQLISNLIRVINPDQLTLEIRISIIIFNYWVINPVVSQRDYLIILLLKDKLF